MRSGASTRTALIVARPSLSRVTTAGARGTGGPSNVDGNTSCVFAVSASGSDAAGCCSAVALRPQTATTAATAAYDAGRDRVSARTVFNTEPSPVR